MVTLIHLNRILLVMVYLTQLKVIQIYRLGLCFKVNLFSN